MTHPDQLLNALTALLVAATALCTALGIRWGGRAVRDAAQTLSEGQRGLSSDQLEPHPVLPHDHVVPGAGDVRVGLGQDALPHSS
jgi:hypothetical protein